MQNKKGTTKRNGDFFSMDKRSFKEHQQDFINVMQQRFVIFSVTKKKEVQLNSYVNELNVIQELAIDSLISAFDREKIKYIESDNGSLQYWINSKSYQYNLY